MFITKKWPKMTIVRVVIKLSQPISYRISVGQELTCADAAFAASVLEEHHSINPIDWCNSEVTSIHKWPDLPHPPLFNVETNQVEVNI